MNLTEAKKKAEALMAWHGLNDWHLTFNKRTTNRFGQCDHARKQLELSSQLTLLNVWERVKLTMLHEIAHALVGSGHGHNGYWKQVCINIGGDGNARYKASEVVMPERPIPTMESVMLGDTELTVGTPLLYCGDDATFHEYRPRNHKFPYIVMYRGRRYKATERQLKLA